jgi:SAM-dependent methyltransferase
MKVASVNPLVALSANPLTAALKSVAREGLPYTIKAVVSTVLDVHFDLRYGTDTLRRVEMNTLNFESEHKIHATWYQPTQAGPLRDILRKLDLPKDGVFVDLGSGKGRVLLIAAQFGFKKVVGVEFSRELCEIACDNVKVFTQRTHITARIDVVESDVAAYPIEPDQEVFFMNNPFEEVVMNGVLANLRSSVTQFPRKIWLIYHNPRCGELVANSELFCACQEIKTSGSKFRVYNNS